MCVASKVCQIPHTDATVFAEADHKNSQNLTERCNKYCEAIGSDDKHVVSACSILFLFSNYMINDGAEGSVFHINFRYSLVLCKWDTYANLNGVDRDLSDTILHYST